MKRKTIDFSNNTNVTAMIRSTIKKSHKYYIGARKSNRYGFS